MLEQRSPDTSGNLWRLIGISMHLSSNSSFVSLAPPVFRYELVILEPSHMTHLDSIIAHICRRVMLAPVFSYICTHFLLICLLSLQRSTLCAHYSVLQKRSIAVFAFNFAYYYTTRVLLLVSTLTTQYWPATLEAR